MPLPLMLIGVFLFGVGAILSFASGIRALQASRRWPDYRQRQKYIVRARGSLIFSFLSGLMAVAVLVLGQVTQPPTTPAPIVTRPVATLPKLESPTAAVTSTDTLAPPQAAPSAFVVTPSPAATATSGLTATPALPIAVQAITEGTQTPQFDIQVGRLRFSTAISGYQLIAPGNSFHNPIKHMYAVFTYQPIGTLVPWSALWYQNGILKHIDTTSWNAYPSGVGVSDWAQDPSSWQEGNYEVQIFVGSSWKASGTFGLVGTPPTASSTPPPSDTPTPRPTATWTPLPTATSLPTSTNTPKPTATWTPEPTATPLPSSTNTPLPTATRTPKPTATPLPTSTNTPLPTATWTPKPTATPLPTSTNTPLPTATWTPKPTATPLPTWTPKPTSTPLPTSTHTPLPTATLTPTSTPTRAPLRPVIPTATPSPTATRTPPPTSTPLPTRTPLPSPTNSPIPSATRTPAPTATPLPTRTPFPSATPTNSPFPTATRTPAPTATPFIPPTATNTPQPTATRTPRPTDTPTFTPLPTSTPRPTDTPSPTRTPRPTDTPTFTPPPTSTPRPTDTPTLTPPPTSTPLPTATRTPLPTATWTLTPVPTNTPLPTATRTPLPTATSTFTPAPTNTPLPTPTRTATRTPQPTATSTYTPRPTNTATPSPVPSDTPVPSNTPTRTPIPTATFTPSITPTPTATATLPPVVVHVYFTNTRQVGNLVPPFNESVPRQVPGGGNPVPPTLDEYFKGPTASEQAQGLEVVRNGFVGYRRIEFSNGILTVYLAGNCRTSGTAYNIADALIPTLKQFPGVQYVKIFDEYDHTRDAIGRNDSWPVCLDIIFTATPTFTPTATLTPTWTPSPTATRTPIPTVTPIPTRTPTRTPVPTLTPTLTFTPTATPTLTPTRTPTRTPAPTDTPQPSAIPRDTLTPTYDPSCNRATFVGDVTIVDNSVFHFGEQLTKTWRLRNTGTCTWTTDYELIWIGGVQFAGPSSVPIPTQVAPNQTVDVSVTLTAPGAPGAYESDWQLRSADGRLFGVGGASEGHVWIKIQVIPPVVTTATTTGGTAPVAPTFSGATATPATPEMSFDFVGAACQAQWQSNEGVLPCPGQDGDVRGFVFTENTATLEDGTLSRMPALLTFPSSSSDGYILGLYPAYQVQQGDHFQALVGCEYNAKACSVLFRLSYLDSAGAARDLWSVGEFYDGKYSSVDLDLSRLAGQQVRLVLSVGSLGSSTGDQAIWVGPGIVRNPVVAPVITPAVSATPTRAPATPTRTKSAPSATAMAPATSTPGATLVPPATPTPPAPQPAPTSPLQQVIDSIISFFNRLFGGK